jgi:hypothetical protein
MYPKKFTVDPIAIARARLVTLRATNLSILPPENGVAMPAIAHFLEGGFKARDKEGKLLLPDLSALCNTTVGIFSDYAGESTGKYYTYTFLACAFGSRGSFKEQMSALRIKHDLPNKEIAFKDFRMRPLRRMLPAYLRLVDQFVSGLVFTLVVEKSIPSLFGSGLETRQKLITYQSRCRLWDGELRGSHTPPGRDLYSDSVGEMTWRTWFQTFCQSVLLAKLQMDAIYKAMGSSRVQCILRRSSKA